MKNHLSGRFQTGIKQQSIEFRNTVAIDFGDETIYITSHDVAGHPTGGINIRARVSKVAGVSQAWDYYNALSTIGSLSVEVQDPDPVNLVPNGTFDSASGWTFGGNWSYDGTNDRASKGFGGGTDQLDTTATLDVTVARWYLVAWEQRDTRETGGVRLHGTNGPFRDAPTSFELGSGWKSLALECTNVDDLVLQGNNDFDGWIDNVTVAELTVSSFVAHKKRMDNIGLRQKEIQIWTALGAASAWTDYEVAAYTYFIDTFSRDDGFLAIRASDVKRHEKKKIFKRHTTTLRESITATSTTVRSYEPTTTQFPAVEHDAGYSANPSATVGYIEIGKDDKLEIIAHTGLSAQGGFTQFNVAAGGRGMFGTTARAHDIDAGVTEAARQPAIKEYIFLQGPTPNLIHQLLCGESLVGGIDDLPPHHHCGVPPALVDTSSFTGIGADWYDSGNLDEGHQSTFERMKEVDGKALIEKSLLYWMGGRLRIQSDGSLSLERVGEVQGNDTAVFELNESNVKRYGPVKYDSSQILNALIVSFNYEPLNERYATTRLLVNSDSIAANEITDAKAVNLRGARSGRTITANINSFYESHRSRFASDPALLELDCLPAAMMVDEGDIVDVNLPQLQDPRSETGLPGFKRTMEVRKTAEDYVNGGTRLALFGSTAKAVDSENQPSANALADSIYDRSGDGGSTLASQLTISANVVTSSGSLTGHATDALQAQFYHLNDLEIDSGVTVTWTNNVTLWIRGFLTITGDLEGIGAGLAGSNAVSTFQAPAAGVLANNFANAPAAFTDGGIGAAQASSGIWYFVRPGGDRWAYTGSRWGGTYQGVNPAMQMAGPAIDAAGNVTGLRRNLRGCGGPAGAGIYNNSTVLRLGGNGGDGGGGLVIICRGLVIDPNGSINTSGEDGTIPASYVDGSYTLYGGSGGGGSPGGLVVMLDGNQSVPSMNRFIANQGASPLQAGATQMEREYSRSAGGWLPAGTWTVGEQGFSVGVPGDGGRGRWSDTGPLDQNKREARYLIRYLAPPEAAEADADELHTIATPAAPTVAAVAGQTSLAPSGTQLVATLLVTLVESTDVDAIGYEVEQRIEGATLWQSVAVIRQVATIETEFPSLQGVTREVRYRILASDNAVDSAFSAVTEYTVPITARTQLERRQIIQYRDATAVDFARAIDLSMSGEVLIFGSPGVDTNEFAGVGGACTVYELDGEYKPVARTIFGPTALGWSLLGHAVAIDGTGKYGACADYSNDFFQTGAGQIFIFEIDLNADELTSEAVLNSNVNGENVGRSISMSKTAANPWLVAGAPGRAIADGRFYLWERTAAATWTLRATVDSPDFGSGERFGDIVHISHDASTVFTCAINADSSGPTVSNSGRLAVYRDQTGWTEIESLESADFDPVLPANATLGQTAYGNANFESKSIACSETGRVVAVISRINNDDTGGVYVFEELTTDTWTLQWAATDPDDTTWAEDLESPVSVAMNRAGTVLFVGDTSQNKPGLSNVGSCRMYRRNDDRSWSLVQNWQPALNDEVNSNYGLAIAASVNQVAVVGEPSAAEMVFLLDNKVAFEEE